MPEPTLSTDAIPLERGPAVRKPPDTPAAHRDPALYAALAVGLALRAGLLVRYPRVSGSGDELLHYTFGVLATYFSRPSGWRAVRDADQVGVLELHAGPLVAVVEQHVDAGARSAS
jgi:hypothetical protein